MSSRKELGRILHFLQYAVNAKPDAEFFIERLQMNVARARAMGLNKVVAAMVYPAIVITMAVAIMGFLLVFIVPKFEAIFHDMLGNKPLPAITQFVIGTSNFVKDHGLLLLGAVVATAAAYGFIGRTRGGRYVIDRFKLSMPLFGDLNRKTAISRFSRTLGTLVTSGVPILL
jgi:type IV pilus assembly protein PilC